MKRTASSSLRTIVLLTGVLFACVLTGAGRAATASSHASHIVSMHVSPSHTNAAGHRAVLTASVSGATTCTVYAQRIPSFSRMYKVATVPCSNGRVRVVIAARQNLHVAALPLRIELVAGDVSRSITIRESAMVAPYETSLPTITGTVAIGSTLTATPGTFAGIPKPHIVGSAWLRCSFSGDNCAPITGATRATYTLTHADAGLALRYETSALTGARAWTGIVHNANGKQTVNGRASAHADSPALPVPSTSSPAPSTSSPAPPSTPTPTTPSPSALGNVTAPVISGDHLLGSTLTVSKGTWQRTPTSYAYAWADCPHGDGEACLPIAGDTSNTHVLTRDDYGYGPDEIVTATVTATDVRGSGSVVVAGGTIDGPPMSYQPPTVIGTPTVGDTLTADDGHWTGGGGPYAVTLRGWGSCPDTSGAGCTTIAGATSASYVLTDGDVGTYIYAAVAISSQYGTSTAASTMYGPVTAVPTPPTVNAPVSTGLPEIGVVDGGQLVVGSSVTVSSPGSWTNSPTSFSYAWQSCDASGHGCSDIPGAVGSTYMTVVPDEGATLRAVVTARNDGGSTNATSDASDVVGAASGGGGGGRSAPTVITAPTVSSPDGVMVQSDPGMWTGDGTTTSFQWQRCDASGASCADIPGETGPMYMTGPDDVGLVIQFVVTATDASGSATASVQWGPAAAPPPPGPANENSPVIAGSLTVGSTLTIEPITWDNGPVTLSYQWERCDASYNCTLIAGATDDSYQLVSDDAGRYMSVVITASNANGSMNTAGYTGIVTAS